MSSEMSKPSSVHSTTAPSLSTSCTSGFFDGFFWVGSFSDTFSFSSFEARSLARLSNCAGDAATPSGFSTGFATAFFFRSSGGFACCCASSMSKGTGSSLFFPRPPLYLELMCFQPLSSGSFVSFATQLTASAAISARQGPPRGPSPLIWSMTHGCMSTSTALPSATVFDALPATAHERTRPTTNGICRPRGLMPALYCVASLPLWSFGGTTA